MTNLGGQRHAFIDCVRGYAVLLVITGHVTYAYPNLPYPVHRFTMLGWFGVQLFFLASAVTLIMSWRDEVSRHGTADTGAFFIRRYFRIAPAYYAAALFYYFVSPPPSGVSLWAAVPWLIFLNDWYPEFTMGAWQVVPGGWSISAEFFFYLVFPLIVMRVSTLKRSLICLVAVILAACLWNSLITRWIWVEHDVRRIPDFMYFYVINQAPVFALGFCLYFILDAVFSPGGSALRDRILSSRTWIMSGSAALFMAISYLSLPKSFSLDTYRPPSHFVASFAFASFIAALPVGKPAILVNRPIAYIGKVSFSCYLLHFAVLKWFVSLPSTVTGTDAQGYHAIFAFAMGWLAVAIVSIVCSACSFHLIERPGMAAGKALIGSRRGARVTVESV